MTGDVQVVPPELSALAAAAFLSRYREPTVSAYRADLRCYWGWCADHDLQPLSARRAHIELYLRHLEAKGYAPATIGRRMSTVAGLFKYAVLDELVSANPTLAIARPKVDWEGQRRTVLHPLEFAAVLTAARQESPTAHALVAMLGMLGLRVTEACSARVQDLRYEAGYELLRVLGKGRKPADVPLPIPVLRAVRSATDSRKSGPILLSARAQGLRRGGAARLLAPRQRSWRRDPGQPPLVTSHFLHSGARQRRSPARHAVRDAARRRPHHLALRHGQDQSRSARRTQRGRLPRRHGCQLAERAGDQAARSTYAGGSAVPRRVLRPLHLDATPVTRGPAGGVPVPTVVLLALRPDDDVRDGRAQLLVAPRAPVGTARARRGQRAHHPSVLGALDAGRPTPGAVAPLQGLERGGLAGAAARAPRHYFFA